MPRRNPKRDERRRPAPITTEIGAPAGWNARRIVSREPGADYVCPRCKRGVPRAVEHVVAQRGDEQHRHWHANCWEAAVREGIDRYRWG